MVQTALVTSGPTIEPLDPVRFISNHSSGKQGHAIASALADAGMEVTLITGPVNLPEPENVKVVHVTTAEEMQASCLEQLPVDIAICVAAVSDWRAKDIATQKLKKSKEDELQLTLVKNPDILHIISHHQHRPEIVIGFAAETENLVENAQAKLVQKGCDYICANQVGSKQEIFGADNTRIYFISHTGVEEWEPMSKKQLAKRLVTRIVA